LFEKILTFFYLKSTIRALLATCLHAGFFLGIFFDPENGGDMFL
jgi:hypothetical protein